MRTAYWEKVAASGFAVPHDAPLSELTAELTVMLGSPDAHLRGALAQRTLSAWLAEGVYDGLLGGLGDGMTVGLTVGLGEDGTDSVFRRSQSAAVLAGCLARDVQVALLGPDTVLRWGDAVMSWFVRERDLRGRVPGKGMAHAVAHGADALRALAANPAMGEAELVAVLDVVADRLGVPTTYRWVDREDDRLARAVTTAFRRDRVAVELVQGWLDRLVETGAGRDAEGCPTSMAGNTQDFLRALHLQLAAAADPPPQRGDLLLDVLAALRRSNRHFLR